MEDNGNQNGEGQKNRHQIKYDEYVEKITGEKHNLDSEAYPVAHRLLDQELQRAKESGKAGFDNRYIDLYNEKPTKVSAKIRFPTKDCPSFNFVGKLLGPKGNTLKQLQEDTKCRMFILGKGSMRDKTKEEELRIGGDPKYAHLSDELHVEVSCFAPPSEAHSRMAYALRELRAVLTPDPSYEDGFPAYLEGPMMQAVPRGPPGAHHPRVEGKTKVMGFLEKARQAMEYQQPIPARRYGPPIPRHGGGYPEHYPRGEDRGNWSGYKPRGGAGLYPPRSTPYARQ